MKTRYAAAVTGLALGLMGGPLKAAPITYNVDLAFPSPFGSGTIQGTIVTDGFIGALTTTDITSFSLNVANPGFYLAQELRVASRVLVQVTMFP